MRCMDDYICSDLCAVPAGMTLLLETYCDICNKIADTRYLDLFTIGSEGTRLCHDCEMLVVEFIRTEKYKVTKRIIAEHKASR